MDKKSIVKFLKENQIDDIEEIKYIEDIYILRFYYDFDSSEIEAAEAYANDECTEDKESEVWYNEFFKPYLNDIAIDNVGDILEDCMNEFNIAIQFITYEYEEEEESSEIVAVFHDIEKSVDIKKVIDDLKL
ncbi:hypothetical protein CPAST_c26280 [Clostridium pasteurianum DSM 525 = ATCC 6013]|uniref:Uncharacterized protein n=1 Tax=Clostridium pasteurianum DSM 525 = ATCC 6013 TaxID=1262449 RepID=A0A0H3JAM5_CLOPA|nr:hypothetical protein [Clostridium pasteurianum]AJA48695.1 hypothetical protein CPAST_c26280 [Clostridium pasteurianum DSM 525 = ATCC 6013]AJA52683.1 hypothetical protein CLPA_c26280 [Clostridium pasteurianum DSM 525 = ATCC 6013]AOZ75921.1 hypothetical protein AQ983_12770 [Clostridium pasteurianum DSM 525 = ATCC 6013]AOZ79717.1 hypothetical protein AQ984_12765 [Clostridium pasteurianum]ELP59994.1 hypothetical protein F502_05142 [Clostridium pasteurianum DSM 525 = ATCC 6013]